MQIPATTNTPPVPLLSPVLSPALSPSKNLGAANNPEPTGAVTPPLGETEESKTIDPEVAGSASKSNASELTESEYRVIAELKKIDREVRAHEHAHLAAAGGLARGGASYGYTKGPDGQRYAVSGEVSIDTSPGQNPQATLLKAQRIQAAALAPSQPSGADRAVASAASQMASAARSELLAEQFNPETAEATKKETKRKNADATDSRATETKTATGAIGTRSGSTEGLELNIRQATSTDNALGNLLNTTV